MCEPSRHLRCNGCGNTSFRVPLEHIASGYMVECSKCGEELELPEQVGAAGYFPCPIRGYYHD